MPWEYRLLIAHPDERDPKGYCHEVSEMLNRSGQEGWEVVGVHKDVFWGVEWPEAIRRSEPIASRLSSTAHGSTSTASTPASVVPTTSGVGVLDEGGNSPVGA